MNPTMTKIQIPMEVDVRDALARKAKSLGFDSLQAYIRVWAKAEVDNRVVDFDSYGQGFKQEAQFASLARDFATNRDKYRKYKNFEELLDSLKATVR
jgi:hypothetical protein